MPKIGTGTSGCGAGAAPRFSPILDSMTNSFIMRISANDFNALVEDLVAALDKFNVPAQEKKDLLALLGPMKKDIVEEP